MTKHEQALFRETALKWRFSGKITVAEPQTSASNELRRAYKAGLSKGWKKPAMGKAKL